MTPEKIARALSRSIGGLNFAPPVVHVYNPLRYAREAHDTYLSTYCRTNIDVLLLGMNPGPWGMAQTGVPFGDVTQVAQWLGIRAGVKRPRKEHPKRPILGFECERNEVSGTRLWGWARERFASADAFFDRFFVWNYCPLAFMEDSGRNRTPDKLPANEREPLFDACNVALNRIISHTQPTHVIGIGKFAETRASLVLASASHPPHIGTILHPSPASPAANRGWAEKVDEQFAAMSIGIP